MTKGAVEMDTKSTMIEYRLSNWVELVQDRECSGLSIKDYCASVGIAEHMYYYRLKKVREAACTELARSQSTSSESITGSFAEVKLSEPAPTAYRQNMQNSHVCFETSGMRVTAGIDYPIEKLIEVLHTVSHL